MAQMTLTTLTNALKQAWATEDLQDYTVRQQAILPYLNKIRKMVGGKNHRFLLKSYPSESSRFHAEDGQMVTPSEDNFPVGYFDLVQNYTRRHITQAAMDDTLRSEDAIVQATIYMPKDMGERHAFHVARSAWYGAHGALAVCGTTSDSTTLQLATNSNMRRFFRNMKIDVRHSTSGAVAAGTDGGDSATISSIDDANFRLVTDKQMTTTSANSVYIEDEAYASGGAIYTYAPNGLPALIGTGDVCNITVSATPEYKSYVNTSTGTLNLPKMQTPVDWIEGRSGGKIGVIITSPEVVIKYGDILIPDIRYTPSDLNRMEGGYPTTLFFRGGSMGTIPIIKDNLCPMDEMYFIDFSALGLSASAWAQWLDQDGAQFHYIANFLMWDLVMYSRWNLYIKHRIKCAKLQAITI